MNESQTRACPECGAEHEATDAYCSACGAKQEPPPSQEGTATAPHGPFVLDEETGPPARRPKPPPPDLPAEDPVDDVPVIELDDDPAPTLGADESAERVGESTVRMPLSDVVKAWTEESEPGAAPAADAEDVDRPSAAGLPLGPILLLAGAVLVVVLLIVLL